MTMKHHLSGQVAQRHEGAKGHLAGVDTKQLGWYACPERKYSVARGDGKITGTGVLVSKQCSVWKNDGKKMLNSMCES